MLFKNFHLSERGAFPFRLDGDCLSSPLKYLINVFFTKFGALIFFIH